MTSADRAPRGATEPSEDAALLPGRRAWWGGLLLLGGGLMMAGVASSAWMGWKYWEGRPQFDTRYATMRGQQLRVALPDGSEARLDAATYADVRFYAARRDVRLLDGQGVFGVAGGDDRPFRVVAGEAGVTVDGPDGARFAVRYVGQGLHAGQARIAVEAGRVRVERVTPTGARPLREDEKELRTLQAGQGVAVGADGRFGAVADVAPARIAPWRDGVFHTEGASLAEVAAEFARYGGGAIGMGSAEVAALRIDGRYGVLDSAAFLRDAAARLPVRVAGTAGHPILVGRTAAPDAPWRENGDTAVDR